jgi:DNA-binding GntR family transcriptional regulator
MSALDAFQRTSTTEHVALALREAIITGELPQGSKLGEVGLAQRLKVGRGPIREAIRQLVQEGLGEYRVNRGTFVKVLTIDDVRDVYMAREAIEMKAVSRIVGSQEPVDFGEVHALLEDIRAAATGIVVLSDRLVEADFKLHRAIVDLAQSTRLTRMFKTLAAETRMFLLQNHPPYEGDRYIEDHAVLVEAVTTRSPNAPEAVRAHLASSLQVIVEYMDAQPDERQNFEAVQR